MEPLQSLTAFFDAIVDRRIDDVMTMYRRSATTYVFVEGPRWSTLGYDQIAAGWRAFLCSPIQVHRWEWCEGPFVETWQESAVVAGLLNLETMVGSSSRTLRVRASFVLQRNDLDRWHIVHEHVSQPMVDPYGIGDWI
ncbi:YybH family protein [Roseiflexus sp.]|uniref:YybH family protein n=1 Tax=Roseiflexus sp. TaxID=2562120 RepID=UPI00398B39EC